MSAITTDQLERLRPYIVGAVSPDGEQKMFCPMHDDYAASAQVNHAKGVWFCHAGCGGGSVASLVEHDGYWIPAEGRVHDNYRPLNGNGSIEKPSEIRTTYWHNCLLENDGRSREWLAMYRGLDVTTMVEYQLGWDIGRRVFTIPVRDRAGELVNVRRYDPGSNGERKMYGLRGHNTPCLYPVGQLLESQDNTDPIIICEGEWDALLTTQHGFQAVTRTGAAHVWQEEWNEFFEGQDVLICQDRDWAGQRGARRVAKHLIGIAATVQHIKLPYPMRSKHGRDLTDFWMNGGSVERFEALMGPLARAA